MKANTKSSITLPARELRMVKALKTRLRLKSNVEVVRKGLILLQQTTDRHGGLYVADLNPRRGTEPGKSRPVLVIQTDLLNAVGHPSTLVLPCTSRLTGESLLRVLLPKGMAGNTSDCEIMIDQARAID